jgi:hypothetical protein
MSGIAPVYIKGEIVPSHIGTLYPNLLNRKNFMFDLAFDPNHIGLDQVLTIHRTGPTYPYELTTHTPVGCPPPIIDKKVNQYMTVSAPEYLVERYSWEYLYPTSYRFTLNQPYRLGLIKNDGEYAPFGVYMAYWEFLCISGYFWNIGLCNDSFPMDGTTLGTDVEGNSVGWSCWNYGRYSYWKHENYSINLVYLTGKAGYKDGDIVQFAWDRPNSKLYLGIKRSIGLQEWIIGDPITKTNGMDFSGLGENTYPIVSLSGTEIEGPNTISVNTTATFLRIPPGFQGAFLPSPIHGSLSPSYLSATMEAQYV